MLSDLGCSRAGSALPVLERDNRAEAPELTPRGMVSRVACQAGIARQRNLRMAREALSQCHDATLRPLQSQCQRGVQAIRLHFPRT